MTWTTWTTTLAAEICEPSDRLSAEEPVVALPQPGRRVVDPLDVGGLGEGDGHRASRGPAARHRRGEGEHRAGGGGVGGVQGPQGGGGGVGVVGGHPARHVLDDLAVVAEIDVDDRRGVDVGDHRVDAPHVGQQRLAELGEDADVDVAGRADGPDQRRLLALEDGHVAGDPAFDRLLEDHVGLVEARLRSGRGVVVDLDGQGRPGRHDVARCRLAGQGAQHRRRRGRGGRRRGGGGGRGRGAGRRASGQRQRGAYGAQGQPAPPSASRPCRPAVVSGDGCGGARGSVLPPGASRGSSGSGSVGDVGRSRADARRSALVHAGPVPT